MVMKILKSLIAGCDSGKKGNVCLANQAILEPLHPFVLFAKVKCDSLDPPPPYHNF